LNGITKLSAAAAKDPYVLSHPELEPFWVAAERDILVLPFCVRCHIPHWYPRSRCPHCGFGSIEWRQASGDAWLYSFSLQTFLSPPNVLCFVRLDEGPLMMTSMSAADVGELRIDLKVKIVFRRAEAGRKVPYARTVMERELAERPLAPVNK
jgi:hypothetical protein